jgi:cell division protease FtsH
VLCCAAARSRYSTGKTLLARAVAGECGLPFFSCSASDFVEVYVGLGASRVRQLFSDARKAKPAIVFIDEIDALGGARSGAPGGRPGGGGGGANDEREQTLNALLTELDGFEPGEGVVLLAATNRPQMLDPALTRPGRIDRKVSVPLPDEAGRHAILALHAGRLSVEIEDGEEGDDDEEEEPEVIDLGPDLKPTGHRSSSGGRRRRRSDGRAAAPSTEDPLRLVEVAAETVDFSGAELANLVNEAAMLAVREGKEAVCARNFQDALHKAMFEKRLMRRSVDGSDERAGAAGGGGGPGGVSLDLGKLMEQMMRSGMGMPDIDLRAPGGGGGGGGGSGGERDSKRRKDNEGGGAPFQDPDID